MGKASTWMVPFLCPSWWVSERTGRGGRTASPGNLLSMVRDPHAIASPSLADCRDLPALVPSERALTIDMPLRQYLLAAPCTSPTCMASQVLVLVVISGQNMNSGLMMSSTRLLGMVAM